jgi:ferredoxin-NADP reductase
MELINCTLEQVLEESPTVRTYRLKPQGGRKIEFRPGQFAQLHQLREDGSSAGFRVYSISSAPGEEELCFTVRINGRFSSELAKLGIGAQLAVSPPLGNFVLQEGLGDVVLIAGGVGCTPFRSMIRHAMRSGYAGKITLLHMNKSKKEIIYREEFRALASEFQNFCAIHFLTQEPEGGYESGRLDEGRLKEHVPNYLECTYFLCGPPAMVIGTKAMLAGLGVGKDRIKLEAWS